MAPTLKQPTDRRGGGKFTAYLHHLSRRERIAAAVLANVLVVLLAAGVGSAVGGDVPLLGDDEEARGSAALSSDWSTLEPLLPLAPSLKDMAALKRSASGGASGVLAAESGGRGGGSGAIRVRALPEDAGAATGGKTRVAANGTSSRPPRPAPLRPLAPQSAGLPSVRRILAARLRTSLGRTNELRRIITEDLRNLVGLPIDIDIDVDIPRVRPDRPSIPPIGGGQLPGRGPLPGDNPLRGGGPLPIGGSIPRIPGRRPPLTLTVVDSRADSRFDVLLVARGRRLLEAYRFLDRDVAGLAAQINLHSSVLVADLLRDGERLARVTAAPLRPDAAGRGSGPLLSGPAAVASQGATGVGAGAGARRGARSGGGGRPPAGRRGHRSGGRSPAGSGSSSGFRSGTSAPRHGEPSRRSLPSRRSTPVGPSPPPKSKPRRGGGRSKASKTRRGRGSSGGHGKGHAKGRGKGHGKGHDRGDDKDDDEDGDDD